MSARCFVTYKGGNSPKTHSNVKGQEGKTEALNVSFGAMHAHHHGHSTGEPVFNDISFQKLGDKTSAALFQAVVQGTMFDEIVFEFYRTDRVKGEVMFAKITYLKAVIQSWQINFGHASASSHFDESVSITGTQVVMTIDETQAEHQLRVNALR